MEKKFVGTVNGKEYRNIEDYNEAIKQALQSGSVSAEMRFISDDTFKADDSTNAHKTPFTTVTYDADGNVDCVCLDYNLQLDELRQKHGFEVFHKNFQMYCDAMENELKSCAKECQKYIEEFKDNPEVLEGYLDDVNCVLSEIDSFNTATETKTEELYKQLDDVQAKQAFNYILSDFYEGLRDNIEKQIAESGSLQQSEDQGETVETFSKKEGHLTQPQKNEGESIVELANAFADLFYRILK